MQEKENNKSESHNANCPKCKGTGIITRPLKLGEFLEQVPFLFKCLSLMVEDKQTENKFLLSDKDVKFPQVGTRACKEFFGSLAQINSFLYFILDLIRRVDYIYKLVDQVATLPGEGRIFYKDEKEGKKYQIKPPHQKALKDFASRSHFLAEIFLVRLVENFLNYLSALLYEIFVQRPETMKSAEKVELESVLSHDSLKSLIKTLAEKKIANLSYNSFKEINRFFNDRFKLEVCKGEYLKEIIIAVELRNISVHNRFRIDQRFIDHTGSDKKLKGNRMKIGIDYIQKISHIFIESVKTIDVNARKKLKLKGCRFKINPVTP